MILYDVYSAVDESINCLKNLRSEAEMAAASRLLLSASRRLGFRETARVETRVVGARAWVT